MLLNKYKLTASIALGLCITIQEPLFAGQDKMYLSGGDTSIRPNGPNSYSMPAANMPLVQQLDFNVGNSFFRNPWITAPSTTTARDGLGPVFNTNACQNCHIKDGRGHLPKPGSPHSVSMLVRLSIPATEKDEQALLYNGVVPDPTYGGQFQDFAVPNIKSEGKVNISYETHQVVLGDGEVITLRKPIVSLDDLNYGAMHPDIMTSLRMAPPMIGLGLLEAIDEKTLLDNAAASADDNISGRANRVWGVEAQKTVLGRFGWKAGQPSLKQQNAAAFNGDIGITSEFFAKDDCTVNQKACLDEPNGNGSESEGEFEVNENILNKVTFYAHNLAVPAQRQRKDATVIAGREVFNRIGCDSCHTPTFKTGESQFPWLSNQTIHPYTDLMLHDMGEGLSDKRPEFIANGNEWRTPPLWGIGLTEVVSGYQNYLHDGRAATLTEAILWHGGEAAKTTDNFSQLDKKDRLALITFLQSL